MYRYIYIYVCLRVFIIYRICIYIYIYIFIYRTNEQMKLTQVSNYWFHVHTFIRIKICEMLNANFT